MGLELHFDGPNTTGETGLTPKVFTPLGTTHSEAKKSFEGPRDSPSPYGDEVTQLAEVKR